jgi:hypothetical protein
VAVTDVFARSVRAEDRQAVEAQLAVIARQIFAACRPLQDCEGARFTILVAPKITSIR